MSEAGTMSEGSEWFRLIFEGCPLGLSLTGLDGSLRVNHAFAEMLGYAEAELGRKKWEDITYPEDVAKSREVVASLLAGAQAAARLQKRYLHKTGRVVWAEVRTALRRDEDGQPAFFVTGILDASAHAEAGREVLFRNVLLTTMQEALPEGVLVVDADHRVLTYNTRFLQVCDISRDVAERGSDRALLEVAARRLAEPDAFFTKLAWLRDNPLEASQDLIPLKDGRTLDRYSSPLVGPQGKSLGRVYFFRDITQTQHAEAALRDQVAELQRWQDVMLDREDRVHELKREVNALCRRLGEPDRYQIQTGPNDPVSFDGKLTTDLPRYSDPGTADDGEEA